MKYLDKMSCHLQVIAHHKSFVFDLRKRAASCDKKITATSQLFDHQKYIETGYYLLGHTNATKDFILQYDNTTVYSTFSRLGLSEAKQLAAHVSKKDQPG